MASTEEQQATTEVSSGDFGEVSASAETATPTVGSPLSTEGELRVAIAAAIAEDNFAKVARLAAQLEHLGSPTGGGGAANDAVGVNGEDREGIAANEYGAAIFTAEDFERIVREEHTAVLELIRNVPKTEGEGSMMRDVRLTAYGEALGKALTGRYPGFKLEAVSRRTFESSDGYGIVTALGVDGVASMPGECGVLLPHRLRIGSLSAPTRRA